MSKPYIERRFVSLEENVEYDDSYSPPTNTWTASVDGYLVPSKESVRVSRYGATANEAFEALRAAVEEQGWELR